MTTTFEHGRISVVLKYRKKEKEKRNEMKSKKAQQQSMFRHVER